MKKYTILIADDNLENIQIIIDSLKDSDIQYKVIRAINGKVLCEYAIKRLPDLIITDWEMPEMNGIEAVKHLKKLESTKDIPIIMCTGIMTTSENLKMALDSGAVDYIRKPIDKIELQARVYSMLKLGESHRIIKEQNYTLEQQKNEIQSQTEELEQVNLELEKLSIVARETSNAVIITDNEGRYIWVNKGYERIFGYELEEVITGKNQKNILNVTNGQYINDLINKSLKTGESVNYEFEAPSKSGKKMWLQTTISPILDKHGSVSKLIAIDSDISKIKEAELEILAQSKLLTMKNAQIMDSINYAKRIQDAILPSEALIKSYFPDSFIYFRPKDIVSGDFYWFSVQDEKLFIAAVDCTGHGVPGAFMSLIGNLVLNHIVKEKKIFKPSEILKELNKRVNLALSQSKSENDQHEDGMDLTVCSFNKRSGEVHIACANHTALILKNDTIFEIEGDSISIGDPIFKNEPIEFTNHIVPFKENSTMYLFSDGYQDQIGGPKNKKFLSSNLKKILMEHKDEAMEKQLDKLHDAFKKWKGTNKQTDDVLVMGIRLKMNF